MDDMTDLSHNRNRRSSVDLIFTRQSDDKQRTLHNI